MASQDNPRPHLQGFQDKAGREGETRLKESILDTLTQRFIKMDDVIIPCPDHFLTTYS